MADFLLEIGSEELPARFLNKEEEDIVRLFKEDLEEAGLPFGSIAAKATPRRLAVFVTDLAPAQLEKEEIITGPPLKIAYDTDGSPSKALTGFIKGQNVSVEDIFIQKTDKGEYIAVRKKSGGKSAVDLLAQICPVIITNLPFAKSMHWGNNKINYGRPLRWILCLLDKEVIPFSVGPVTSGRLTWGHRVLGNGPFSVPDVAEYEKIIAVQGAVTLDPHERIKFIRDQGDKQAREKGGEIIWKDSLLAEVSGLVEYPLPLLGDFDSSYLEIPEQVLLTSMESHQKSFGVRDQNGKLLPHFLTVLNLQPKNLQIVKNGWERVLKARLEDARFFWKTDLADTFENWLEKLEHVIFIGSLGSMADKSRRLRKLCAWLAGFVAPESISFAEQAGQLAKADLVSGMVGEFDTLQGIMGGIYAAKKGKSQEVSEAIQEQYLPAGPESPLPHTYLGAILAIADKADTLAGCFGLDMIPGGAADPNGLRRCALGIIRILIDHKWDINLQELFAKAREFYGEQRWKLSETETQEKLLEFFNGRLRNYFINLGYETPFVDAALACGIERIPDCKTRLDAIVAFSKTPNFEKCAQVLKRVENISKKAEQIAAEQAWEESLLQEDAEKALAKSLKIILPELDNKIASGDYSGALALLEQLREPVDSFFDNVMVLCENPDLRMNRLKMLKSLSGRFASIALFSALQI